MELDVEINRSLSSCSIGRHLNDICHKTSYTKRKGLCSFSSYSCDIQKILQLRTECKDIQNVCYHHEQVYTSKYSHLFGQTCCDPLERRCSAKKSLRPISIEKVRNSNKKLIPGRKLCRQCEKMLEASEEIANNEEDHSDLFIPKEEKEDVLNKSFTILGESPIKKKKLSAEKCLSYGKQKVEKVNTAVKTMIASVLEVNEVDLSENTCGNCNVQHQDSVDLHEILCSLKEKFETESTSVSEKLQILTIIPQSWTIEKTCKFFDTTEHMVKKARRLRQEKGPLGVPGPKKASFTIPENVVKDVLKFYESTDVSRICPGKNDYISVRQPGQSKQEKQKHLILCNLKEAYTLFKQEYPNHKIGFSKFADLRPKWCVLAGSTGTHSVCVCMIHQNVKLMMASLKSVKPSISDFLSHYVCDINKEACMLGLCSQCPLQTAFEEYLDMLMDDYDEESKVSFRRWITTDRSTLISITLSVPDFKSELLLKMMSLAKHHFIAKSQSEYLKTRKAELKPDECILLLDFSENFTFIVQDAIQGYHWVNTQATLHPFVAYVRSNDNLKVISMCIISDCLTHDTVAVASFQRLVIPYLTSQYPDIKKIIYFSDGSSAQYKNKKNFLNLCHHNDDFKLTAE